MLLCFAAAAGSAPTLYNETKWFHSLIRSALIQEGAMLVKENWIGPNEKLEIRLLSSESSLALFTEHRARSLTGPDPEDHESQVGFKKYEEGANGLKG